MLVNLIKEANILFFFCRDLTQLLRLRCKGKRASIRGEHGRAARPALTSGRAFHRLGVGEAGKYYPGVRPQNDSFEQFADKVGEMGCGSRTNYRAA